MPAVTAASPSHKRAVNASSKNKLLNYDSKDRGCEAEHRQTPRAVVLEQRSPHQETHTGDDHALIENSGGGLPTNRLGRRLLPKRCSG